MAWNYGINPHEEIIVLKEHGGTPPETTPTHIVFNIGRTPVKAETLYGTEIEWKGVVNGCTVRPGDRKVIENYGEEYLFIGLRIRNLSCKKAFVFATTDQSGNSFHRIHSANEFHKVIRQSISLGAKFPFFATSKPMELLFPFWCERNPDIWEQLMNNIHSLVSSEKLGMINDLILKELDYYQKRFEEFQLEMKNAENAENVETTDRSKAAYCYMKIAHELVDFEHKFIFHSTTEEDRQANFGLLPLYSTLVWLKMLYYSVGDKEQKEIGLTPNDVLDLKILANRLIKGPGGAINYMKDMYNERVQHAYDTGKGEDIYNIMMDVRSYIAVCGLEYIAIWKSKIETNQEPVYNDVISYSEFFGRQTPELGMEATSKEMTEPLTPNLINGKRNRMIALELYMFTGKPGKVNYSNLKIAGLNVIFENNESYLMGTTSTTVNKIEFQDACLTKLKVYGDGKLDCFTFCFSDGREETYGSYYPKQFVFELEDHHIASIFLSSDTEEFAGQAVNIAVSYIRSC